jgi:hypothetical protein
VSANGAKARDERGRPWFAASRRRDPARAEHHLGKARDRLLGGVLYGVQPRVDWATLLRRSLSVDVLERPRCHGRLRVVAVITERVPVRRVLALGNAPRPDVDRRVIAPSTTETRT